MNKRLILALAITLAAVVVAFVFVASSNQRRAESVQCGNYMASIGCAARLWANDRKERLPSDLASMSNELTTTKILVCPGDHSRQPSASWALFTPAQSSYEIVTPGLKVDDTNEVFFRCKIHGHRGYADMTVFDGVRRRTKTP